MLNPPIPASEFVTPEALCSHFHNILLAIAGMLFKTHFKVTTLCSGLPFQSAVVFGAQRVEDFSFCPGVCPPQRFHVLADVAWVKGVIRASAIIQGRLVSHRAIGKAVQCHFCLSCTWAGGARQSLR